MLRYYPPKSSVWGHSLRRMPVKKARDLFAEFLASSAASYRLASASLWEHQANEEIVARYANLIGMPIEQRRNTLLTHEQAELCLAQLIKDEKLFREMETGISLWCTYEILQWKAAELGASPPPASVITICYDNFPHLMTELFFNSTIEFERVKVALTDIGLCKLNPKHLKETRRHRS